jgi:HEAT repeat protein
MVGLCDADKYTRYCALQSLGALEPMVVAVNAGTIARALTDPSNAIVRLAARTLDNLFDYRDGPSVRMTAAKAVSDMLLNPSWMLRETAVITLGSRALVGIHAPYIGKLIGMLGDSSHIVSWQACVALKRQPLASLSPYADCVSQKLTDPRDYVRKHAIHTLCHTEPKVLAVYAHCISHRLSDESEVVREAAVYAIGEMKPIQTILLYVNIFVGLLDDTEFVRVAVCRVLRKVDPVALIPHLDAIGLKMNDPSTRVRVMVIKLLGKQEPIQFAQYIRVVSMILNGPYPCEEISAARRAIKLFSSNLSKLLNDLTFESRRKALDALCAAGCWGEAVVLKDKYLAGLIQRAEEDESHKLQIRRLQRSYLMCESKLGSWVVHAAKRELERARKI